MNEDGGWAIGEVATRVGLDVDTLRYYERRGVVPRPPRDSSGRRRYDEAGVHLIEVLLHLKGTGMPLTQIAEFTRLVALDPGGVSERLALLRSHRATVRRQIETWTTSLGVIDGKIDDYRGRLPQPSSQPEPTATGPDAGLTEPPPES